MIGTLTLWRPLPPPAKLLITKKFTEDERRFVELSLCLIYGIAWSLDRVDWKQHVALPTGKFGYISAIYFGLLIVATGENKLAEKYRAEALQI